MEERKSRYELFLEEEARKAQPTKRCSKCGKTKALTDFHKKCYHCKACRKIERSKQNRPGFWDGIVKHATPPYCWTWGNPESKNHTRTWRNGERCSAQHLVYEMSVGPVPAGYYMIATCRNIRCVNPLHMRVLTSDEYRMWLSNHNSDKLYGRKRPGVTPSGEQNHKARFTEKEVRYIRDQCARGRAQNNIAGEFGCTPRAINSIVKRRTWKHVE